MSIYAADPHARPDDEFEVGTLRHLVAGNRGRLLDPRRTPVSLVEVRPSVGFALFRIEGFEDAGAIWEVPLERVDRFQFERASRMASEWAVAEMEAAVRRFGRNEVIEADAGALSQTEARIEAQRTEALAWLDEHSRFLAEGCPLPSPATRQGDPRLLADLESYARECGVWELEASFARHYVSNPESGEMVKGHRIVLAELGLAAFAGTSVRDPATFAGTSTRARRVDHVIARLAFLRALFTRLRRPRVTLWRGFATGARLQRRTGRTFVSTSFDEAVARSHYQATGTLRGLVCRDVPVGRLFMTYLETAAMNDKYREAEAVVLDHPHDHWP